MKNLSVRVVSLVSYLRYKVLYRGNCLAKLMHFLSYVPIERKQQVQVLWVEKCKAEEVSIVLCYTQVSDLSSTLTSLDLVAYLI